MELGAKSKKVETLSEMEGGILGGVKVRGGHGLWHGDGVVCRHVVQRSWRVEE